mmetsp:Transcript_20608/g.30706  ORF Transcript_20608/g.30706 Transcript_20608/m.30706 type:complete len:83 (+) Transcript_20608:301-549(+)
MTCRKQHYEGWSSFARQHACVALCQPWVEVHFANHWAQVHLWLSQSKASRKPMRLAIEHMKTSTCRDSFPGLTMVSLPHVLW